MNGYRVYLKQKQIQNMPINNILKEEISKNFQEHNQSSEAADLCIKILNIEHDSKLSSKQERTNLIKELLDKIDEN